MMITTPDLIIGFTGIATAVATVFLVHSTDRLLFQQKKEESIKYNPYLNIDDLKLENSNYGAGFHINFNIKNSGATPAHKLKISCEFIFNNNSKLNKEEETDEIYTIVMPNAIRKFSRYFDEKILDEIRNNKNECDLLITLSYVNYNNNSISLKNTISLSYDEINRVFDHGYKKQDLTAL
jgi:hypothetical protein